MSSRSTPISRASIYHYGLFPHSLDPLRTFGSSPYGQRFRHYLQSALGLTRVAPPLRDCRLTERCRAIHARVFKLNASAALPRVVASTGVSPGPCERAKPLISRKATALGVGVGE